MTTQMFAFIRAINTGRRRLTNEQVLEPFHALGLAGAAAYQAAGNVTFRSDGDPSHLEDILESALAESYGYEAPTFVRTADELHLVLDEPPFPPDVVEATEGRTQISFLKSAPSDDRWAEVLALVPAEDAVEVRGRHCFWLPRAGVSDSLLPVLPIERLLGPSTMRTVGTVERMLAKFADLG